MKYLTLEEIKKSQLETLAILRDYCEKNGLQYFLAFGTLLGAVRHKGFIPWDDDVDVFMPRDDYEFLIEHFNENAPKNREFISGETCSSFYLRFAKIIDRNTVVIEKGQNLEIGVWVDIFPMDYLVENKALIFMENIPIGLLSWADKFAVLKPSKRRAAYKNIIIRVMKFLLPSHEWLFEKRKKHIDRILSKEKTDTYGLAYNPLAFFGIQYTPRTTLEPSVKIEFEKDFFDAPRDYDKLLKYFYGKNYMALPPKEKQISHHQYVCFWRNENGPDC